MIKFIYSVCINGDTHPEMVLANSLEEAEKKVEYIYGLHISNKEYNSYLEFIYKLYECCEISLSEIFNIDEL